MTSLHDGAHMARAREAELEAAILAAHAAGDPARLSGLYATGAARRSGDAAAFLLTQAWVYALEAGLPEAPLRARLAALGRV